jgi:hypothetical protein
MARRWGGLPRQGLCRGFNDPDGQPARHEIRLEHKLNPEQEIRILCCGNNREALFRVVGEAGEPIGEFSFWGPPKSVPDAVRPAPRAFDSLHQCKLAATAARRE